MSSGNWKKRSKRERRAFWATTALILLAAAACALITISEKMERPFLPTWDEIFGMAGLTEQGPLDSQLRVDILDVGNADAILVRNGEASLLIDAGENNDGGQVVDELRSRGVTRLDYAIATHPDADHIGGMDVVVNQLEIGTFIMAFMPEGATPTTRTYLDLLQALADRNLTVTEAIPGQSYPLGEAMMEILGPPAPSGDTNNNSVVCRVSFGSRRFLFMGDAEREEEDALMAAGTDLRADFIKLGHHGSRSSSQKRFLERVNPSYAAMTCGAGNSYGHPHAETLKTLNEMKITYTRSDLNGTVKLLCDGSVITVTTEK
ncbi:MAG: MBL fold metallo-hydrolase [Clostridiales bacterium]|nr:MBL fold metallo-hydrolase [Clostridiales bacterium]